MPEVMELGLYLLALVVGIPAVILVLVHLFGDKIKDREYDKQIKAARQSERGVV